MGFKLVRVDSQDPCKILLQIGTHIIGRGKFLDCDDKRVSRNHGEIVVGDDSITIKALHRNPLFYIKKAIQWQTEILAQNCTQELFNGDKFGLLPDTYWYEVIYCINKETLNDVSPAKSEQHINVMDTTINNAESSPESPSLLNEVPEQSATENFEVDQAPNQSPSKQPPNQDSQSTIPGDVQNEELDQQAETELCAIKRSHSQTSESVPSDEVKKIKVEPDNIKNEPDDGPSNVQAADNGNETNGDQDEPNNAQAGPSCKQAADTPAGSPPSPVKPPPVAPRERCLYGANCYRKNPQHKAQFSHPADSDWGAGPLGSCPWGARCRRRDPRHWTQHAHPPGTVPPDQRGDGNQGKRRKEKKKRDSSDEDTPAEDLIVTVKRARKTIPRAEYSSSESDSDPYKTDGSDEWQPSGNTDSQIYSQDD